MWLEWLRPALTDATEAELIDALMTGKAMIWPGDTAAMVTSLEEGPEGRFLHVWLAGGDLDGVMALKPGVEAWGRAMGCKFVNINGRRGWARLLRGDGFALIDGELRKPL